MQLGWSSPSIGPEVIVPRSQLYPVTNPPPAVALTSPTNGAAFTASASVTMTPKRRRNIIACSSCFLRERPLPGHRHQSALLFDGNRFDARKLCHNGGGHGCDRPGHDVRACQYHGGCRHRPGLRHDQFSVAPAFYNMPPVFTGALPQQLSLTGVFSNTPDMVPVASLIPYAPNVPLWSDGAQKGRYFSIPNNGPRYTPNEQIGYAPTGTWSFPAGTVFVKTFEVQTNVSDPNSYLRLETRLLVRDTNGAVYGVTYKWRADYSDADLLTNSLTEAIPITTPTGVVTQNWYYPEPE